MTLFRSILIMMVMPSIATSQGGTLPAFQAETQIALKQIDEQIELLQAQYDRLEAQVSASRPSNASADGSRPAPQPESRAETLPAVLAEELRNLQNSRAAVVARMDGLSRAIESTQATVQQQGEKTLELYQALRELRGEINRLGERLSATRVSAQRSGVQLPATDVKAAILSALPAVNAELRVNHVEGSRGRTAHAVVTLIAHVGNEQVAVPGRPVAVAFAGLNGGPWTSFGQFTTDRSGQAVFEVPIPSDRRVQKELWMQVTFGGDKIVQALPPKVVRVGIGR